MAGWFSGEVDVLFLCGAGFALVALGCVVAALLHGRTAEAMDETPTTPVGEIDVPGYYEVVAQVRCLDPIDRPEIQEGVAWFHLREVEEWQSQSGGGRSTGWENLLNEERGHRVFALEQDGKRVRVDPADAEVEPEILGTRREDLDRAGIPDRGGKLIAKRRDLMGLAEGNKVYVIGPVEMVDGHLTFKAGPGGPFRISTRSEKSQRGEMADADPFLYATAVVAGLLSAAFFSMRGG